MDEAREMRAWSAKTQPGAMRQENMMPEKKNDVLMLRRILAPV
jgi:hypothetical protein